MKLFLALLMNAALLFPSSLWAECSQLTAGGVIEYPPYMWQTMPPNEQLGGALIDLTLQVAASAKINIQPVYTGSWARTQNEFVQNHLDMLAGIFYNKERAATMDYLYPPLGYSKVYIWVHKDSPLNITSLEQLQGLSGATVAKFSLGQEFDMYANEHLNLLRLKSIRQGFKMLSSKRIDYVVYEEQPGIAILNTMENQTKMLPFLVANEGIYLAISKNSKCNTPSTRAQLEKSLKEVATEKNLSLLINTAQQQWRTNVVQFKGELD